MTKEYLKNKTYDEIKVIEKSEKKDASNLIEPTDKEKLEVIYLLRNGKSIGEIKKEWKRDNLSLSKAQIKAIEADWKEALKEKKPKEENPKKEKKVK